MFTDVTQQDVPVTTEWVGTTDGLINAAIRANVTLNPIDALRHE